MQKPALPTALSAVAWLFLLSGIASVIAMAVRWSQGSGYIDLSSALNIFAFFGLRRLSRGWRLYALGCVWLGLVGTPLLTLWMLLRQPSPFFFGFYGQQVAGVTPAVVIAVNTGYFLLALWQLRVLTRPDIRALFYPLHESMLAA